MATSTQLRERARRARAAARTAVHRTAAAVSERTAPRAPGSTATAGRRPGMHPMQRLSPAEALATNGFTVFRGVYSAGEVADLARRFKADAGITEGVRFTKTDAVNQFPTSRAVLFDDRVQFAVRTAIGEPARFLQLSDLHYFSDTSVWHRDSVHRGRDDSGSPDWDRLGGEPYKVVKAILYLEAENAAMGILPGSHLSPRGIDEAAVKRQEAAGQQVVLDDEVEINQRFTTEELRLPFYWKANPGDLLVFDQRLYHCGRRVEHGRVDLSPDAVQSPKLTLSLLLGADNLHSYRMYSYFRYARPELSYRDLPEDLRRELTERNLVLSYGWDNYYLQAPDELREAYARNPDVLEQLIRQFRSEAAAR